MTQDEVRHFFALFTGGTGGIDDWIGERAEEEVLERLGRTATEPLTRVQLNQLLVLSHEAGVSDGFFKYYWTSAPDHPYDVTQLPDYDAGYPSTATIQSLAQLRWGLRRLYTDGLLCFGNIPSAYRSLRTLSLHEIDRFFRRYRFPTEALRERGPALDLVRFARDDRYLVSEMACKSYEAAGPDLKTVLLEAYRNHVERGDTRVSIGTLLDGSYTSNRYADRQLELKFSADEILAETVNSEEELESRITRVAEKFTKARSAALQNTRLYLSLVNELDVYVATSMRTREDFRSMAETCDEIFGDTRLQEYNLRYFDPTLSAAEGHEDKGLIECLMVKSAKILVYIAGAKESYGKDAEAAMALSLGKPVIFLCDTESRTRFYRDVHPLSRLIEFSTGVVVGAMVTDKKEDVAELLYRLLTNTMSYELDRPQAGYYRLKEKLTDSVVRLQTSDALLRETFWNYYHAEPARRLTDVAK